MESGNGSEQTEPTHSEDQLKQVCPGCGETNSLDERTEAGNPLLCPICGAEMFPNDFPGDAEYSSIPVKHATQTGPIRTEDLLLERLIATPAVPQQVPTPTLAIILTAIILIGVGIFFATRNPEKFAPESAMNPESAAPTKDSTELFQHRAIAEPKLDSLKRVLAVHPNDSSALIDFANTSFDLQYWEDARHSFETYLKDHPKDIDARIDYATTLDKVENDPEAAINEIEKALEINPHHVRGLFNAGILSLKLISKKDHTAALAEAKSYFERARHEAETQDTTVLPTIDGILSELAKVHPTAPAE